MAYRPRSTRRKSPDWQRFVTQLRLTEVAEHVAHHPLAAVPHFLRHGIHADRRTVVHRLQPCGAVGGAEDLRADLTWPPPRMRRDRVERASPVGLKPFLAGAVVRADEPAGRASADSSRGNS